MQKSITLRLYMKTCDKVIYIHNPTAVKKRTTKLFKHIVFFKPTSMITSFMSDFVLHLIYTNTESEVLHQKNFTVPST